MKAKKLHFPDFLVNSEEYLEPNQVSMMELFGKIAVFSKKLNHRCLSGFQIRI